MKMARVNDISFAEILERMENRAMDEELYEIIPLIAYDGPMLDKEWRKASPERKRMFHWLRDMTWREHILQTARINELTA